MSNGIPSHDTIAQFFAALNPEELQQCFLDWVSSVAQLIKGEIVAIEGKTLRHSYGKGAGIKRHWSLRLL